MVERAKRGKGKQKLLASHQRSWIWGRNLVRETLAAARWPIVELYLAEELPEQELTFVKGIAGLAAKLKLEPRDRLTKLCHSSEHQGYLAKMGEFPYADAEEILGKQPQAPLYAVLDSLQDPYNFGAVIRSAEVFGLEAVFIGATNQVPVNSLVARASAGAVNRIPIVQADDLPRLAEELRREGVPLVGCSEKAVQSLPQYSFQNGAALVLGNEGSGIGPALQAQCDALVRIPQAGKIGSLNVAAAAAVAFYEARRGACIAQPDRLS